MEALIALTVVLVVVTALLLISLLSLRSRLRTNEASRVKLLQENTSLRVDLAREKRLREMQNPHRQAPARMRPSSDSREDRFARAKSLPERARNWRDNRMADSHVDDLSAQTPSTIIASPTFSSDPGSTTSSDSGSCGGGGE